MIRNCLIINVMFIQNDTLWAYELKTDRSYLIKLKDYEKTLNLLKKVFKNGDGSVGTLYIASNDLELNSDALYNIYQKRWIIEDFHKEIKKS